VVGNSAYNTVLLQVHCTPPEWLYQVLKKTALEPEAEGQPPKRGIYVYLNSIKTDSTLFDTLEDAKEAQALIIEIKRVGILSVVWQSWHSLQSDITVGASATRSGLAAVSSAVIMPY